MRYWVVLNVVVLSCFLGLAWGQKDGDYCKQVTKEVPNPGECDSFLVCTKKRKWLKRICPASHEFCPQQMKCVGRKVSTCQKTCDTLPVEPNGGWSSTSCTSAKSPVGTTCTLRCNPNYSLSGSAVIKCTAFGWNSTNGIAVPTCKTLQCYSQQMKNTLNSTLQTCAGMLFVLDESGSIGSGEFVKVKDFVKELVLAFKLDSTRTGGAMTFDSVPREHITLTETNTNSFLSQVDRIIYHAGGTDVLQALQRALIVIERDGGKKCYVVILLTDGNSQTEATPAADALKRKDHPIFSIAVGSPDSLSYVESLSSKGKNGVRHFFYSRNFDILKEIGKYFNSPPPTSTQCGP